MMTPIRYVETPVRSPRSALPLGDMVAAVAQPIARAADAVLGTSVANCGGCKSRQAKLNSVGQSISETVRKHLF